MVRKPKQRPSVLSKYEQLILAVEATASSPGCSFSPAAFLCPVSFCPCGSAAQDFFDFLKGAKAHEFEICLSHLWDSSWV